MILKMKKTVKSQKVGEFAPEYEMRLSLKVQLI